MVKEYPKCTILQRMLLSNEHPSQALIQNKIL
jgi:hypothetical protein